MWLTEDAEQVNAKGMVDCLWRSKPLGASQDQCLTNLRECWYSPCTLWVCSSVHFSSVKTSKNGLFRAQETNTYPRQRRPASHRVLIVERGVKARLQCHGEQQADRDLYQCEVLHCWRHTYLYVRAGSHYFPLVVLQLSRQSNTTKGGVRAYLTDHGPFMLFPNNQSANADMSKLIPFSVGGKHTAGG